MSIDGLTPLHKLQETVQQLSVMDEHSNQLIRLIDVLLERTYADAPKRVQGYKLVREERPNPVNKQRERLLEKAIWKQWNSTAMVDEATQFHSELCPHIQTFQMPLQGRRTDRKWGKIDLVGTCKSRLPVVLELKRERASDTPLRMVVEGLAYAVALRRAWNEGHPRQEWQESQRRYVKTYIAPNVLPSVPVIGIAPKDYWRRKIGVPGRRSKEKVPQKAWEPFLRFCEACSLRGFPLHFLEFTAEMTDIDGLPIVRDVARIVIPNG